MITKFQIPNSPSTNLRAGKFQIILAFVFLIFFIVPAIAITPTPTPTPAENIKQKVQERIDNLATESQKKAFWGTLKNITNATLIVDSTDGEKRIKTDSSTVFLTANKKAVKINDLEIGNFLIALGLWQENGTLDGKRIIVLPTAPKPAPVRNAYSGQTSKIDKGTKILTITKPNQNLTTKIQVASSTIITKMVDGKITPITHDKINLNDWITAVGTQKVDGGVLTAKRIHIIPGLSKPTTIPSTTLRASPTPTTKTSTKISPTPTAD